MAMGKYFGTDGYRGEANVSLTADAAFRIGKFLAWHYQQGLGEGETCKIVIGKDTRRSSYMFEYAIAAGITAAGADAYLMHVTTTPSVAYIVKTEGFRCGVMISASHNPFADNGIKVINEKGEKLSDEVAAKIEDYLDGRSGEVPLATGSRIGRTIDFVAGRNRYIGFLISLSTRSFKGHKVALDCANGSASSIAKAVFDALGAETCVINNEPDGTNINRHAGSTDIAGLQRFVVEKGCEIGFAFDGDADRCLAVDSQGRLIDGDAILFIEGKYLKKKGLLRGNKVVTTVMSNLGLYKALDKEGIEYDQTDVGDRFVYEDMVGNGYALGGENSGHIIFLRHETTGDGIVTAIKLLETIVEEKKSVEELLGDFRLYPQILLNIRVKDRQAAQDDEAVAAAAKQAEEALGANGRILLRASGTEPLIRVMVEAPELEVCRKWAESVIDVIKARGLEEMRK